MNSPSNNKNISELRLPSGTLRILQITDTHLYADPQGQLLGINTLDSFQCVIEQIRQNNWPVDIVLVTGDLVHDASPTGYQQLSDLLDNFELPVYCLPGNHDVPEIMHEHLKSEFVSCPQTIDLQGWRLILLNSVKPNSEGGHLADDELQGLQQALANNDKHTLISLHHQPVPVGSTWIDSMTLDNADKMFEIVDQAPQVRGILWGHVHQQFDQMRGQVHLMASPSTCVQFAPESSDFSVDKQAPGFRLLALTPDGQVRSQVIRTAAIPLGLDLASSGY